MLYHLLRTLFIPTYKAYFKSVHISGKNNLPKKGPVILAVNHTSAFMDPILIAVLLRHRVYHFLARGEAFNSKIAVTIYKMVNMLPIYRPETMPDQVHKNKFVFQQCYDHLKKGKAIMMFPEGFSQTVRRLRPVKTGLARMAFGAEYENDFELGIKIVPVGLNYSNPHHFRSDVFINVGEELNMADYKDLYRENPKKAINELTEHIRLKMEETIVHISDERLDEFVENLEYLSHENLQSHKARNTLVDRFNISKDITTRVRLLSEKHPETYKECESRLNNFTSRLKRLNLRANHHSAKSRVRIFFSIAALIIGFIPFLTGLIGNIIPIYLTSLLSAKVEVRDDFVGSLKSVGGMFIFLIYYVLLLSIFSAIYSFKVAWIIPVALYFIGLFSIYYSSLYKITTDDIRYLRLKKEKKTSLSGLSKEKNDILKMIDHDVTLT